MDYDASYAGEPGLFGTEPDAILVRFVDRIDVVKPVLDIGAGQGRHALHLARLGRTVHALEPSPVGARQLAAAAQRMGVAVSVLERGYGAFEAADEAYAAVLAFGLIPDLRREQIGDLIGRLARWTVRGGLVFLTGFTTEDPSFAVWQATGTAVGEGSFVDAAGRTRTFLAPGEVLRLLPGFDALHHWEGLGPVHRHGDGEPERHGRFEAVLRRP